MSENKGNNVKIGMIFPGQGSQFLGMAKEIYDCERIVQEFFEEASNCLDQNFVRLCFASSEKELRETVNAQTSIFLASASIFSLLREKYGIIPDVVAGHSSGEYAAVFAAGGISFPDALYLLKKRSFFMEEATKEFPGTMIAVLGLSLEKLKSICEKLDNSDGARRVAEIVNYNSPTQFVVSGTAAELDEVAKKVRGAKGKVVKLNVAGAFHSRLMQDAEKQFSKYMVKVDFKELTVPLVNNVQARLVTDNNDLKESLVRQMSSQVLWWPSMQWIKDCDVIIEVGPGTKLSKILKRECPEKDVYSLNSIDDLEALMNRLGKEFKRPVFEGNVDLACASDDDVPEEESLG